MRKFLLTATALLFVFSLVQIPSYGENGSYSLFIPDCDEQYHSGMKVLVAGVEHNLTFYRDSENITVILYSPGYLNGTKNETTYYRWRYFNGEFYDMEYGKYINRSSSTVFGDSIAFHIGIYSKAEGAGEGERGAVWHLMVRSGDVTVIEDDIFVEAAVASLAISAPDFEFRAEPQSSGRILPEHNQTFRTKNTGNLPLYLTGRYDKMGDRFYTTNMSIILRPGEEVRHMIYLTSLPWSPQIFNLKEHIKGIPMHVMNVENINFIQAPSTTVNITVKVVRPGFNIIDIGKVKLQYEQGPKVSNFNEVMVLRLFLNGNGSATLEITPKELLIKGIYYDGMWHNKTDASPRTLRFHLEEGMEEEIRIAVQCYKESVDARLNYQISDGNRTGSAYTDIVVGKAPKVPVVSGNGFEINRVGLAIAGGFVLILLLFIVYHHMSSRRAKVEGEKDKNRKQYGVKEGRKKRNRR